MKLFITEIKGKVEYIGDNVKQVIHRACNLITRQSVPALRVIEIEVPQETFANLLDWHITNVEILPQDIDIEKHISDTLTFIPEEQ